MLFLQHPETMSLLGEPLYAPSLPKAERKEAEAAYASARAAYEKTPSQPAAVLAYAQANRALGRIGDALEILTHGLEVNRDEPHLLFARGRGYIVIRKFEVALRDLRKAAASIAEARCAVGFASYLSADFARARDEYAQCPDPGIFGPLASRRAASVPAVKPPPAAAPAVPPPIRFPGSAPPPRPKETAEPIATRYLDAIERLLAGDQDGARDRLKKIVDKNRRNSWMDDVYIAAEADYSRLYKPQRKKRK